MSNLVTKINVPTREEVSPTNQAIFDNLEKALGFVPNLYATFAHSENALGSFLQYANSKTSFTKKEKEVIDLTVSQVNACRYCQSAHTAIAKMNGFTDEQVLELRQGSASFNEKYNVLANTSKLIAEKAGQIGAEAVDAFLAAGYTKENLVDLVIAISQITVTNYLHNITDVAIDFPLAPEL